MPQVVSDPSSQPTVMFRKVYPDKIQSELCIALCSGQQDWKIRTLRSGIVLSVPGELSIPPPASRNRYT